MAGSRGPRLARKLAFSLVPVSLLLVTAAIAGELWIRRAGLILDPAALKPSPMTQVNDEPQKDAHCYRPSLTAGYEPVPNTCFRNTWGFIAEHPLERAPGDWRVLVLGDSIAHQHHWIVELEQHLDALLPDRNVQGWNGGVPGYDTCHELRTLEERGGPVEAELILVQFCLNDFLTAASVIPVGEDRVRVIAGKESWDLPRAVLRSQLLTWALTQWVASSEAWDRQQMDHYAITRGCFARIQDIAAERDAQLVVAIFPALISGDPDAPRVPMDPEIHKPFGGWRESEARIEEMMRELGIHHVVLRDAFEGQPPLESFRIQDIDPWHPNEEGQRIIGQALADEIHRGFFAEE